MTLRKEAINVSREAYVGSGGKLQPYVVNLKSMGRY
jgi:hypothetical protein